MHRRPGPDRLQGLLWAGFATTAVITAVIVPAHILVQGVLGPLGIVPAFDRHAPAFASALGNPLLRVYLLVLMATTFYTGCHRARYLLPELGLHVRKRTLGLVMYGLAALATIAAAYVIFTL